MKQLLDILFFLTFIVYCKYIIDEIICLRGKKEEFYHHKINAKILITMIVMLILDIIYIALCEDRIPYIIILPFILGNIIKTGNFLYTFK